MSAVSSLHSHYDQVEKVVSGVADDLIKWRRCIHENPELGYEEEDTSKLIAETLREFGFEVTTGLAKTGVVGILRGKSERPLVGLRADIDCLPIEEKTGLPFASKKTGTVEDKTVPLMHACGHDAHAAILLATAEALSKVKDDMAGSVMLVFQPSEESNAEAPEKLKLNGSGAVQMVYAEKLFDKFPMPDVFFGLHVLAYEVPRGTAILASGPAMASSDTFKVVIKGKQTHGSQPWTGHDAIVCAAQIINSLQTVVSREADLQEKGAAVLTIGTIHGGVRHNVVPGEVEMKGTLRALTMETRKKLITRMTEISEGIAAVHHCTAEVTLPTGIPPVINDPVVCKNTGDVLRTVLGGRFVPTMPAVMGSDDMSVFLASAPGAYFFLSCAPNPKERLVNHMSNFDVHEPSLLEGVRCFAHLTFNFMEKPYQSPGFESTYKHESETYSLE